MAVKAGVVRDWLVKGGALAVLLLLCWCLVYCGWDRPRDEGVWQGGGLQGLRGLDGLHPALAYDASGRIVIRGLDLLREAPRGGAGGTGDSLEPRDLHLEQPETDPSPTVPSPEGGPREETEVAPLPPVVSGSGGVGGQDKRLPDCLIIGARRGGTYPLLRFLSLHPQVINTSTSGFFQDSQSSHDLDWYRGQMPAVLPGQVLIERSQDYLHRREVPELVFNMNSSVRLMVVLRDPLQRMISDYYAVQRLTQRTGGSHVALEYSLEELVYNRTSRRLNYDYGGLYKSKYFKLLAPWLEWFSEKQIHFVDGDAFANRNPSYELQRVEEFLGLRPWFNDQHFYFSMKKGFWCSELTDCMRGDKGHHYDPLDPVVEAEVRNYFRPFNQNLYRLIGRDLGWK